MFLLNFAVNLSNSFINLGSRAGKENDSSKVTEPEFEDLKPRPCFSAQHFPSIRLPFFYPDFILFLAAEKNRENIYLSCALFFAEFSLIFRKFPNILPVTSRLKQCILFVMRKWGLDSFVLQNFPKLHLNFSGVCSSNTSFSFCRYLIFRLRCTLPSEASK